jgi:hypothetical protein
MLHKVGSRAYSDIQRETERERERARAHERERERKRERDSDIEACLTGSAFGAAFLASDLR